MLFFEKGLPVMPPVPPAVGLEMVLKYMTSFVEGRLRPTATIFFRTQSPRHFEGGEWNQGGSCQRLHPLLPQEVEKLFSVKNNGTNVEARLVNQHLYKAIDHSVFNVLDITRMSEFRADAHPSTAGGKKHDDCMHWCLPGITDTWNDLLIARLNDIKGQN
ncbi:Protein trichome birefringence-like 13 [Sarracenia purpurea var. burkii]